MASATNAAYPNSHALANRKNRPIFHSARVLAVSRLNIGDLADLTGLLLLLAALCLVRA